jgi:addiction module HigA family antidote
MAMKNPPHPGEVIRELCLDPLGLTVTAAAKGMGVSLKALSELLNGHSSISPEMAIRLSKAFGGSPESWLKQQMQYDLAQMQKKADSIYPELFIKKGEPCLTYCINRCLTKNASEKLNKEHPCLIVPQNPCVFLRWRV